MKIDNLWKKFIVTGAGKSTTIGMLSGTYFPTSGDVFIFGNSIKENRQQIQEVLGVCPQV